MDDSNTEKLKLQQPNKDIAVLLVCCSSLIFKGIRALLADEPNINLIEHATNKLEMILSIQQHNPKLVIINFDRTDSSSTIEELNTLRHLNHEFPNMKFLLITKSHDLDHELQALKYGVRGIILENFEDETLIKSIKTIALDGLWIRREVMEKFITEQLFLNRLDTKNRPCMPSFTKRELEIIRLAVRGQKNKEIGENLFISEKTVKHHLTKIFRKLKINKRVELKGLV